MDNYPEEFTELQKRPNEELQGRLCVCFYVSKSIGIFLFSPRKHVMGTH